MSSSLYVTVKLSKTTFPQKLFRSNSSHCIGISGLSCQGLRIRNWKKKSLKRQYKVLNLLTRKIFLYSLKRKYNHVKVFCSYTILFLNFSDAFLSPKLQIKSFKVLPKATLKYILNIYINDTWLNDGCMYYTCNLLEWLQYLSSAGPVHKFSKFYVRFICL